MSRTLFRSGFLASMVVSTLLPPACRAGELPGPPIAAPKDRVAWLYEEAGASGWFLSEDGRRWAECTPRGTVYRFRETARSDEAVEMLDASRDVTVRLSADHMAWRRGPGGWNRTADGRWVAPAELPPPPARPGGHRVKLVYFVPTDREPTANHEAKVRTVAALVAETFRLGLKGVAPARPLRFEEGDGGPRVHLVRGARPAAFYSGSPNYDGEAHFRRVVAELPPSLGSISSQVFLVFPETYDPGPAPVEWGGSVGMGGRLSTEGGAAVMSAWMMRDEFCETTPEAQRRLLFDRTPIEGRTSWQTRRVDSPRFEFIEDGFGAAVHELGHSLGLRHDVRDPGDIMGQGFRDLRKDFEASDVAQAPIRFSVENARLLATSPYLSADYDAGDLFPPEIDGTATAADDRVHLKLRLRDNRGLRALVVYDRLRDSVVAGQALAGKESSVTVEIPRRPGEGDYRLQAIVADGGGHHATIELAGGAR